MNPIRNVASLVAAQTVLQIGGGLFGVWLPLVMHGRGFSETDIGLVAAAYSLGFMGGAWISTRALAAVGHIRAFAACAAVGSAAALALAPAQDVAAWMANRALFGFVIAVMFAAAESWMTSVTPTTRRGDVIGFYMLSTKVALMGGPFLIPAGAGVDDPGPFMLAGALFALALVPLCATQQAQPEPPKAAPIALRRMIAVAPAAVAAAFMAGVINAGVMSLSPLWAQDRAGAGAAATFQASAWIGSLLVQWHAGKLSDRYDRRLVIAALTGTSCLAAFALAFAPATLSFAAACALFAVWGAGSLSFYGIAVAHMADRSEPSEMAGAAAGLLFVWAIGSILGPAATGLLIDHVFGPPALFAVAAVAGLALTIYLVSRLAGRAPAPAAEKAVFKPAQTTSVAQGEFFQPEDKGRPAP